MKLKMYKIIFLVLFLFLIAILSLIGIQYTERQKNEVKNKTILKQLEGTQVADVELAFNDVKVIGKIYIPNINIEYPILEKTDAQTMKMAITKFNGGNINDYGNLALAGHNNRDGTMFGKTKELQLGDWIELTDLTKRTIQYEITEIFLTDPNDVSILNTRDENVREITLITCSNGNKNRLIIKAVEKK